MPGALPTTQTLGFEEYHERRYVPVLDGLRAISVLGVLAQHSRGYPLAFLHGYRGVYVFFALSGFLITGLALREESRTGSLDLRAFYLRRCFRIFPLYYLVLAIYVVAVGLHLGGDEQLFHEALPYYLLYFQEYPIFSSETGETIPFGLTWTLGVEEKFYLLWPLVAFVLLRGRRWRAQVAGALAVLTTAIGELAPQWLGEYVAPYTGILLGCTAACLLHRPDTYERLRRLGSRTGVVLTGTAALLVTLAPTDIPFVQPLAYAAVVTSLALSSGFGTRALSTRPLVRLGRLSYAFYLTHSLVLNVPERVIPDTVIGNHLSMVVGGLLCIPVCEVLHRTVEQPMIRLGHRLSGKHAAQGVPSSS